MAILLRFSVFSYSIVFCLTAGAQATSSTENPPDSTVVISAQKRDEQLQRSAISVSAVTASQLQNSGVQTVSDIARMVPGLNVVSSGPGQ
ncbi:TonB-dependent receptor plug domain-containing protein, partial [Undibacterium luofuense]|uniref:TonB-dependent receptor plug domain-containing protein n=1 Tax=Undibacterium luofuense TaxID=2828733 RepID=UPI0030EB4479